MKGDAERIVEFLEGSKKRFIVPVYQRNYNWKKENCKVLFDDLVNVIHDGKSSHFFGSIVSSCQSYTDVILIDGQQRVTTISLLMIAMINAMKCGDAESEDESLKEELESTYIIDRFRKGERKVRLKPFRNDCDAFDRLIFSGPKDYIDESNVTINYRYFYNRIVKDREISIDELYQAIQRLEIIHIQLEVDHGDDPQLIFESLNSTGLDLSESDKVRNFILMRLSAQEQEDYYNKYWFCIEQYTGNEIDSFIRNYLTIKTGVITPANKVYYAFKSYTLEHNVGRVEEMLKDMLHFAEIFRDIKHATVGDEQSNAILRRMEHVDYKVALPFIMPFISSYRIEKMEESEQAIVLSVIETYLFRRQMCELLTNGLNKVFSPLHNRVIKLQAAEGGNVKYSSVLIYILESYKFSNAFPKDEEFLRGFTSKNVYKMQKHNRIYLFERLENGDSKERNDIAGFIESGNYTIEHIMPQTLSASWKEHLGPDYERIHEEWLHTIANLTLTGYNSDYSNQSFEKKKTVKNGFNESALRLNHYLASFDQWTENELKERKKFLSEQAKKLWPYPETDFKISVSDDDQISLGDDIDLRGQKPKSVALMGTAYDVDSWADVVQKLCKLLYDLDPSVMHKEASNPENYLIVSKPRSGAHRLYEIVQGVYVDTWNDTPTKFRLMRNIISKYNLEDEDVTFILRNEKNKGNQMSIDFG